jgi:hypothetical protein
MMEKWKNGFEKWHLSVARWVIFNLAQRKRFSMLE